MHGAQATRTRSEDDATIMEGSRNSGVSLRPGKPYTRIKRRLSLWHLKVVSLGFCFLYLILVLQIVLHHQATNDNDEQSRPSHGRLSIGQGGHSELERKATSDFNLNKPADNDEETQSDRSTSTEAGTLSTQLNRNISTKNSPTKRPISANDGIHINVKHIHREVRTDNAHVFFNVYVNPEGPKRSLKIAREQMRQLANSTLRNNKLYYNVIGANYSFEVCDQQPILKCEMMHYYPQGNEELTLQALFDYCQYHPTDRVIYIHNKGSFRKERGNTKIRRLSTTAVSSHACLEMPLSEDYPCNVCGLTFQSKPYFHMTANMWVAECTYVRQLLPPKVYTLLRTDMMKRLWEQEPCLRQDYGESWDLTNTSFLKALGLGRYAMERWLFGHFHLIPCDVIPFRLMRFKRGFEDWFEPVLRHSRHLIWDEAEPSEAREIWLLIKEFELLYAYLNQEKREPNFALQNYTGNVQPSPCI